MKEKYDKINKNANYSYMQPIATITKPTDIDYQNGHVYRYFVQEANNISSPIYEIDNAQYGRFSGNALYRVVRIRWRLTGDIGSVIESNKKSIMTVYEIMPNLKNYILNLTQFIKK